MTEAVAAEYRDYEPPADGEEYQQPCDWDKHQWGEEMLRMGPGEFSCLCVVCGLPYSSWAMDNAWRIETGEVAGEQEQYCRRCDLFRPCFCDEKPGERLAHINNPGVVKRPEERTTA
jgi:hypothetical protein